MKNNKTFDKITVIGLGLIGSSICRALRKYEITKKVVGYDKDLDILRKVKDLNIVDLISQNLNESVIDSDIIFICTPVGSIPSVAKEIQSSVKWGAILTDTGSVKGSVCDFFKSNNFDGINVIPSHPVAGTEKSGPIFGFHELFIDRWCIFTPMKNASEQSINDLEKIWTVFGSKVEIMDSAHHDLVLAVTSHLPHLISYNIVGLANDIEKIKESDVIKYSAGGFRDFTRIASSNPIMWRDVFLNNKDAVIEILGRFIEDLSALQKAIRWEDGDFLEKKFKNTREIRNKIFSAGQGEFGEEKLNKIKEN
ncbi:MAG: Prephenate dehydrogenase [Alphaproteobacteria bacterium MarineAlpha2_Bin1]|nr:MAG: Prephenate dehydrogenase [Alphaproteobacteria bacterium MarineAlpha2_Bin1]